RFPPFPDGGQPGIAFQWLEVEGPLASTEEANSTWHVLFGDGLPDDADTMDATRKQATALRLLRRFIQQAAREPVAVETLQRYEQLVLSRLNDGANLQDALLTAYRAFLCSSHFLFLSDPSAPNSDEQMHFAIASRLSHFLTNTRPDAALQELARTGQLRDAAVIQRETSRLIETPGFDRFITSFTDYWLALRHLNRDEPDIRLYPEYRFDAYLLESMQRETQAFFAMMIRENLPVTVLIDADFVLVNDRLAEHYRLAEDDDLPPVIGSALQRIPVPDRSPYGGLLTQAAVLKVTSGSTATSPVVRGAWIMDRLLGQPAPPPPASVPAVVPDIRGAKSIRELLALHTESASCAKCHAKFDPVGLALENYDIFGQWRTRYRGLVAGEAVTGIDRAGHDFEYHLAGAVDASGQLESGEMFADIHELKQILLRNPRQLARNLVLRFIVYSTGAEVRFSDRAEVEAILDRCEMNGYRVRDLLDEVIQSRIFAGGDGCR
ncbi:MAG: DUF1592 domain-containing protein, partial [Planctomycetaceae bacterium]|nr:DUF1592 domain-containing protein [Planctomycetaceae bacterium]